MEAHDFQIPYPGLSNVETIENVSSGYRMPPPENCPKEIYDLMLACWDTEPENRPTFKIIHERLVRIWKEMQANLFSEVNEFENCFDNFQKRSKIHPTKSSPGQKATNSTTLTSIPTNSSRCCVLQ